MTTEAKVNPWADTPEEQEVAQKNEGGNADFLQLQQGKNKVRIVGTYKMFLQYWIPRVQRTVVAGPLKDCPLYNHPEKARLFELGRKLKDEGKKEEAKEAFRKGYSLYEPRPYYAVNVIDRADGKMKVLKFSRTLKEAVMDIASVHGDPTNYDLTIVRRGKDRETKYTVVADSHTSDLTEEEKKLRVHNLNVLYKPTSLEKVQGYLQGRLPAGKSTPDAKSQPEPERAPVVADDLDTPTPEELEALNDLE